MSSAQEPMVSNITDDSASASVNKKAVEGETPKEQDSNNDIQKDSNKDKEKNDMSDNEEKEKSKVSAANVENNNKDDININIKRNGKDKKQNEYLLHYVIAVIVAVIAVLYYFRPDVSSVKINYRCPSSQIYIPANGQPFKINALSKIDTSHTINARCKWSWKKNEKPENLVLFGRNTCELTLDDIELTGTFFIDLVVHAPERTTCTDIQLIFHPVPYFGIDLGTTYSSISYQSAQKDVKNKRTANIVTLSGNTYSMPTAIFIPPNDNEQIRFGTDALDMRQKYPENVIYDIKRVIGRNADDEEIAKFNDTHTFNLHVNDKNRVVVKVPKYTKNERNVVYHEYYPEETLAPILAQLVHTASKLFSVPYIPDIVISHPAYFKDNQKRAIQNACKIAGLNPVQLVVEPTAAALSHAYYSSLPEDDFKLFMVFDFGGGTLDCSILQCYNEQCQVYHVGGNDTLGGINFDHVIVDIMKKKYKTQHKWKPEHFTPETNAQLLTEAERVKKQLSNLKEPKSHPIFMSNGVSTEKIFVTRKDFEDDPQTQKLLDQAIATIHQTINDDPDHVMGNLKMLLMVGGTTRIPFIKTRLEKEFPSLTIPNPDENCELTVVKGTSVIGGELAFGSGVRKLVDSEGNEKIEFETKPNTIEVTAHDLGFAVCDGFKGDPGVTCGNMDTVVPTGTRYPVHRTREYVPYDRDGFSILLELFQGRQAKVKHNTKLSDVTVNGFTKTIRTANIVFQIDRNGIVEITASVDGKKNVKMDLSIRSDDNSLTKEEIKDLKYKLVKSGFFPVEIQAILK